MIEETVKIHDKFQFELKFTYQFKEHLHPKKYNVDTYIFIPKSLGVGPEYYSKSDFYHDIQSYIRLKTPVILIKNISGDVNSPMAKLKRSIERLSAGLDEKKSTDYTYRLKMFCSIFRSALRDEMNFVSRQHTNNDKEFHLKSYLENSSKVLAEFRELRNLVNVSTIPDKFFSMYLYADEYLSLQINEYRHELYEFLVRSGHRNADDYMENILKLAREEITSRKNSGYPSIPTDNSDNEMIIFRRNALKKFVSSVLFLGIKTGREGALIEQLLFGLAAALAMAFATGVAFFSKPSVEDLTMTFFMILVVSYIFKDRMKELLRNLISVNLQKYFFDHKTKIYSNSGHKIGILKENFSFIKVNSTPKQILDLRRKDFMADIDETLFGENVMLYKKQILLFSNKFKSVFPDFQINGINDIIRMDISSFLGKMDNPEEDVFIPKKSEYHKIIGSRVYHINLIIKYSIDDGASVINRFRLILNRNGIKRIEEA